MKYPRTFPDAALCKTRHVDGEIFRCLSDDACRCPYGLAFAYSHYCRHSDGKAFSGRAGGATLSEVATPGESPWQPPAYAS